MAGYCLLNIAIYPLYKNHRHKKTSNKLMFEVETFVLKLSFKYGAADGTRTRDHRRDRLDPPYFVKVY